MRLGRGGDAGTVEPDREGKTVEITVTLDSLGRFFNSFDPAPFCRKKLDADAAEYILNAVMDSPADTPLKLVFYLPPDLATPETAALLENAVRNHFTALAADTGREMRLKFREGRFNMAIGLLFLFVCLSINQILPVFGDGTFITMLRESFLIIGWVALWEPVQFFLYGWHPARTTRRHCARAIGMPVEVRPIASAEGHSDDVCSG